MWKKEFKDLKNLLNYRTFDKLKTAAQHNKKIHFMRYVNGKTYKYKIVNYKGLTGIIIKNTTDFFPLALQIEESVIKENNYLDFITKIQSEI